MPKSFLNRMVLSVCLLAAGSFLLVGCASDDEHLVGRRDPGADGEAVPGAATPAPNARSGGWW